MRDMANRFPCDLRRGKSLDARSGQRHVFDGFSGRQSGLSAFERSKSLSSRQKRSWKSGALTKLFAFKCL